MLRLQTLLCLVATIVSPASANTEKTIFLGPEPVNIPQHTPSLADLRIDTLTPTHFSLRSHIDAIFPTRERQRGTETWLLLDRLTEGQRYEVRVCWLATQPTAFHLDTFALPHVFETPELLSSLYNYSMSRQDKPSPAALGSSREGPSSERQSSVLFLRISAAAEYFTLDNSLMDQPDPVLADLILDPFLFNLLPRTLAPTVAYVLFVALVSWALATKVIMPWLTALAVNGEDDGQMAKKLQ